MMTVWHQEPWLRRTVFLIGNLAAMVVITVAILLPVRDFLADRDAQIIHQRETLARWRAIAAQEAAVQSRAEQVAGQQQEFLGGKNEGVIQAEAQTRLKSMVEKAGSRLRSIRGLQSPADPSARSIGTRIELYGTLHAVHRAVYAMENAKPYLFTKGAVMRLAPASGPAAPQQEPIIEAQLDVFGVMRLEAGER